MGGRGGCILTSNLHQESQVNTPLPITELRACPEGKEPCDAQVAPERNSMVKKLKKLIKVPTINLDFIETPFVPYSSK